MRNESSGKYPPRPPVCPSCAQLMSLARTTSRFGNLPDLYIFECRACGVSHIDAADCSEYRQAAIRGSGTQRASCIGAQKQLSVATEQDLTDPFELTQTRLADVPFILCPLRVCRARRL